MNRQQGQPTHLGLVLRALAYRNYRLFFLGQVVSLVGTWLSMVATSWLVYRLATMENRPAAFVLGLVGFAGQFPVFLLTPLAGVWVDRWNRHAILVGTQTVAMLQSFALAALTLTDVINIPQLMALGAIQGVINAIDLPTRQAFVVDLVTEPNDLSNAIALNSSMVNAARLVGPAIGGYLIYVVGEGFCFLIDGFSYLAVIVALLMMRVPRRARATTRHRAWTSFREGLSYAFGFRPIRSLLTLVALTSLVGMSQGTLMPIFAAQILGGGERVLGLLLGASGFGALVGSIYLASRRSVLGLGRWIAIAGTLLGVALIAFSLSRWLSLSMLLLAVTGFSLVVQLASANTVLQTIVDDDKRGRVMALFAMAFLGVAPLGSLLSGAIAGRIGAPACVAIAGGACLVTALVFALRLGSLRELIRPIYEAKGIRPRVIADATEAAVELEREIE